MEQVDTENQPTQDDNAGAPPPSATPDVTADLTPKTSGVPGGQPGTGEPGATPTLVRPVKRGGLAGIVDEFRDAVAGKTGSEVYTDDEGNAYVRHPQLSKGQQWFKIAAEALRGAVEGGAAGQGPGGVFRAGAAGFEAADKQAEKEQKTEQQNQEQARQANLDKFNMIKLKHEISASEFALGRAKVKATQDDITFSQQQLDREKALGSADLGVYKDEADLANVKKVNPDFWKDVHANQIVSIPEYDSQGNRAGIHLYLRTPGIGSQLVPQGTPIKVYSPGDKPTDAPTLKEVIPTVPMTHDQVDSYNNAATAKMQTWVKDHTEQSLKEAQTGRENADTTLANANARKADAETNKINAETADAAAMNDDQLADAIWQGQIVPEKMSILLSKPGSEKLLMKVADRAKAAGETFDTSKLQAYPKLLIDYNSGKRGQQLTNLNTAFQTIDDLKKLNTFAARNPMSSDYAAFKNKLTTASAEIANGLSKPGNAATKDEIHNVNQALTPWFNRDTAIDKQAESLVEQYVSFRNAWQEGAPSSRYEAKMPDLSHEARDVVRKYSPDEAQRFWGRPVTLQGKVVGYTLDGKNMTPEKVTGTQ